MTINFSLNKSASGKYLIMAGFRDCETRRSKYTGYTITDKNLFQKKRVKGETAINVDLAKWENNFSKYIAHCKEIEQPYNIDEAIDHTFGKSKFSGFTFLEVIDKFKEANFNLKPGTLMKYGTLKCSVEDYQKKYNVTLMADNLPGSFYVDFAKYMIQVRENLNSTTARRLVHCTTVLKYAVESGIIKSFTRQVKVPLQQVDANRFPLTLPEIQQLRDYRTFNLKERALVDAFLFSFETGMRYSDVGSFKPSNVLMLEKGCYYCEFNNVKTSKKHTVPLTATAYKLIKSYETNDNTPVFKLPTSQELNQVLKRVAKKVGLNRLCEKIEIRGKDKKTIILPLHEVIHIHAARHSYATNLIASGANVTDVQQNMGHGKLATTMKYYHDDMVARFKATLNIMNNPNRGKIVNE